MDIAEIQKRLDAMPAAMSAKGLRLPNAMLYAEANREPFIALRHNIGPDGSCLNDTSKYFRGSDVAAMLDDAEAWITALPSADETKRNTFLAQLGKVIDLGRDLGQDVGTLAAEMKRIASNALTDQRDIQPAE